METPTKESEMRIIEVPLKSLKDNPYQPRKRYPKAHIKRLSRNIQERGLMQPISVVEVVEEKTWPEHKRGRLPKGYDPKTKVQRIVTYIIVAGHRRTRAYKRLRMKTIPAIVRRQSTKEDLAIDLAVENAMRKDFNPLEKSQAIAQVLKVIPAVDNDLFKIYSLVSQTHLWIGRKLIPSHQKDKTFSEEDFRQCHKLLDIIDIAENTALQYLKLLDLLLVLQNKIIASKNQSDSGQLLKKGFMTVGQAYELSRLKDDKLRVDVYKKMVAGEWRGQLLSHVINELLERGAEANNHKGLGTGKAKRDKEQLMGELTKSCTHLASKLKNACYHVVKPLEYSIDKAAMRGSLMRLREEAIILAATANRVFNIDDGLQEANAKLTVEINRQSKDRELDLRFTLPRDVARTIGAGHGDKVEMQITGVIRKNPKVVKEVDTDFEGALRGLMK